MPQTRDHLQILDLLDVRGGAIVVTKADLVSAQRLESVIAEIHALVATTTFEAAAFFTVSARTGDGIPAMIEWLADQASRIGARITAEGRLFRMPIDRAFSVACSGTVVTGTVHAGRVAAGEHPMISPLGQRVLVRAIQVRGAATSHAVAGQRCALARSR